MTATMLEAKASAVAVPAIVDCDIHPAFSKPSEIYEFLPARWRQHLQDYGPRTPKPLANALTYPRMSLNGMRLDAYTPDGDPPASDLSFLRQQHLDPMGIEYGVLQPIPVGHGVLNLDLGTAMCAAVNDWQVAKWTDPEPRLKASICLAQEDPIAAVAEIERWAGHPDFVQIALPPRSAEPLGRKRYWPIFEAAERHNLPIGLHPAGTSPHANSGSGWMSFYTEEHFGLAIGPQTSLLSMIFEGVFERFPGLRVVLVETGFVWVPSFAWRLDQQWQRMRSEVPHLKRPPSEQIRDHVWYTTQPMAEPETPTHLYDSIRWIGPEKLLFSTDYPHWDFDDPRYAFKVALRPEEQRLILHDNAYAFYGLGDREDHRRFAAAE